MASCGSLGGPRFLARLAGRPAELLLLPERLLEIERARHRLLRLYTIWRPPLECVTEDVANAVLPTVAYGFGGAIRRSRSPW